jgi:hypothetical protein
MVGHQDIGVNVTAEASGTRRKTIQIKAVIFLGNERDAAIVAPLDNVLGNPRKIVTR